MREKFLESVDERFVLLLRGARNGKAEREGRDKGKDEADFFSHPNIILQLASS
jgi:hypothetical protein